MLANAFVGNAKVMAKGRVTIPKDVREVLGAARANVLLTGDKDFLESGLKYSPTFRQAEALSSWSTQKNGAIPLSN